LKLVPFKPEYLRVGEAMPFGVRDAAGRLLLAAGQRVHNTARLDEMRGVTLYADEQESSDWYKRLTAAMEARVRQNALLRDVAAARPEPLSRDADAPRRASLAEQWQQLVTQLDAILREARPDGDWLPRLYGLHERARELAERRPDAALYLLVYEAGHSTAKYSSHHAMLSMLMSEQAARLLAWQVPWIDSLGRAALLMNVAMLRLQDRLASEPGPLTAECRTQIGTHAERGAELVARGGCEDELCREVIRLHHDADAAEVPLASLPPARQLARLLRRVDIFAAQISLRATREPMSPVQAARAACLSQSGVPDEVGSAILRAVGLYPPGSFVELMSGDVGIVVARGRRANMPYVAALLSAGGNLIAEPALRDTLDRRYAVKGAVPCGGVKVRPPHDRLLAMR
jgi:HD-GYP domain-containing protein (c-di-GMP phosphodiesterase class II)